VSAGSRPDQSSRLSGSICAQEGAVTPAGKRARRVSSPRANVQSCRGCRKGGALSAAVFGRCNGEVTEREATPGASSSRWGSRRPRCDTPRAAAAAARDAAF